MLPTTEVKKMERGRPHALFLAHHFRGHLAPAFYMSLELARLGVVVSFVSFEKEMSELLAEHKAELRDLELLRFLMLPNCQPPSASPKNSSSLNEKWKAEIDCLLKSFRDSKDVKALFAGSEPPTLMIVCMFLYQSKDLFDDLQIPRYTFYGAGAGLVRFHQALEVLFTQGHLRIRSDDHRLEDFEGQIEIAGLPGLPFADLPRPGTVETPAVMREIGRAIMRDSDGILINTSNDIERGAMEALRKSTSRRGQKFYAIGPLGPNFAANGSSASSEDLDAECLRWLNLQPPSSVIYICFGTLFRLTSAQIEELALGLERTKHRFLWVLPKSKNSDMDSIIPDFSLPDFEKRVAGFGYMTQGWVPQMRVLGHPSTSAFLTHCGWNSCLEAIGRGVPMIASPLGAEQHINCRLMVENLRIATEVWWKSDESQSRSVEGAIRRVMEEEEGKAMKSRAKALQASLLSALAADGCTVRERREFVKDIRTL